MGAGLRALTALLVLISVPHQLTAQPQAHGGAERKLQQGDHLYDPQALFTEEKQKEEVSGASSPPAIWWVGVRTTAMTDGCVVTRSRPTRSSSAAQTRMMSKTPWDTPTPWLASRCGPCHSHSHALLCSSVRTLAHLQECQRRSSGRGTRPHQALSRHQLTRCPTRCPR